MITATLAALTVALAPPMPLQPVAATGDSWVIATATGEAVDAAGHDLTMANLTRSGFTSEASAEGALTIAHAATHASMHRHGLGWRLLAGGTADASTAPGDNAFGRADITVQVEFTLERAGRVHIAWELAATGIASGFIRLRNIPAAPATTLVEDAVNSYIVPDLSTGTSMLHLDAGRYALAFAGTVQANSGFESPTIGGYTVQIDIAALDAPDLNADGSINGADLGVLLAAWDTAGADLNGDGTTNGADLGLLLAAWEL